jgi:hypothetical protein
MVTTTINANTNFRTYWFKQPWDGRTFSKDLNFELPLVEFYDVIKPIVIEKFGFNQFEIIEAGLDKKEHAEPITFTIEEKLSKFNGNSFYVRPLEIQTINQNIPPVELIQELIQEMIHESTQEYDISHNCCVICLEEVTPNENINLGCFHHMNYCIECIDMWIATCYNSGNPTTCPLCRNNI